MVLGQAASGVAAGVGVGSLGAAALGELSGAGDCVLFAGVPAHPARTLVASTSDKRSCIHRFIIYSSYRRWLAKANFDVESQYSKTSRLKEWAKPESRMDYS